MIGRARRGSQALELVPEKLIRGRKEEEEIEDALDTQSVSKGPRGAATTFSLISSVRGRLELSQLSKYFGSDIFFELDPAPSRKGWMVNVTD